MANSEVSRLKFNNTTYDIADELARQNIGTARTEIATEAARLDAVDTGLASRITNLENSSGAVLVAKTKSAMSDTSKIYVYTGSESGMTRGNWYYHNGSAWVSGGAYNQNLDAIDATLTQSNKGADAKVTGDRLTAAETDISTLRGTIANEYASQAYAVGDYCYHNGLLYRCNTEISVGETWTRGHWTAVDVMPELNNLKNDMISGVKENIYVEGELTRGYLTDSGDIAVDSQVNAMVTNYIPVESDKTYVFLAKSENNPAGYHFRICGYDESKTFVRLLHKSSISSGNSDIEFIFTTDTSVAFIRLSLYRYTTIKNKALYIYDNGIIKTGMDFVSRSIISNIMSAIYSVDVSNYITSLTLPGITASTGSRQVSTTVNKCRTNFIPLPYYGYRLELSNPDYKFCCWFYRSHEGAAYSTVTDSPLVGGFNHLCQGEFLLKSSNPSSKYLILSFGRADEQDLNMDIDDVDSDYNKILDSFKLYSTVDDAYSEAKSLMLHELTNDQGILSVIKRTRQLTDAEWIPAVDIPRVSCMSSDGESGGTSIRFNDIFKAGVKYKGLPYSAQNVIGHTIPISGFVSAVENPDSVECVESHYINSLTASYYGTTCMTLVGHALNIPQLYPDNYLDAPGFTKKFDVKENGAYHNTNEYELCDILGKQGTGSGVHVAIITDIIRNNKKDITYIEVSESTISGNTNKNIQGGPLGGMCRRKMWPVGDFVKYWSVYSVYKYEFPDASPYNADKYSPMINEVDTIQAHYLPLIPYKGNYCKYYSYGNDVTVKLLISDDSFTHIRLYMSNGTHDRLISIPDGATSVDVTLNGDEGKYIAYLCTIDDSGYDVYSSHPCQWLIIGQGSTSCTINSNHIYTIKVWRPTTLIEPFICEFDNDHLHGKYHLIRDYTVEWDESKSMYLYTYKTPHPNPGISLSSIKTWFQTKNFALISGSIGNTISFSN